MGMVYTVWNVVWVVQKMELWFMQHKQTWFSQMTYSSYTDYLTSMDLLKSTSRGGLWRYIYMNIWIVARMLGYIHKSILSDVLRSLSQTMHVLLIFTIFGYLHRICENYYIFCVLYAVQWDYITMQHIPVELCCNFTDVSWNLTTSFTSNLHIAMIELCLCACWTCHLYTH